MWLCGLVTFSKYGSLGVPHPMRGTLPKAPFLESGPTFVTTGSKGIKQKG